MSYLSDTLSQLMQRHGIKGVDLSKATGIDPATISRWLNGAQKSIADDDLARVCRALTEDPREQARLIAARMQDVKNGPGSDLIEISIAQESLHERPPEYGIKLPSKVEAALQAIRRHVMEDEDLKDMVLALGNMYRGDKDKKK